MARGWESKSVEEQQAERQSARTGPAPVLTPAEIEREHKLRGLELSRTRLQHDLEKNLPPRYREQLEAALRHIEEQISALTPQSKKKDARGASA